MIRDLINKNYDRLSENGLYILNYTLNKLEECQKMSITELADGCAISKSSIFRMTQSPDFSELNYSLKAEPKPLIENGDFFEMQLDEIK